MDADQVSTLLDEGRLADAVGAVAAEVKAKPMATAQRILLAELLVLQGANERADTQLKLAADQAPADMMAITQMRWLIRASEARRAWYEESAVPSFIGEPTQHQRDVMRLALFVRDNEPDHAASLLETLEDVPLPDVAIDGAAAAPFRDVCDFSQHGFEALALDGRYLWIAPHEIDEMSFTPVRRPRDLLWRQAETRLKDGRQATFYVVAQYHDPEATEVQCLAQNTAWIDGPGGTVRGRGQKVVLAGEESRGLLDIEHIAVQHVAVAH
jgi:type VI secretion system protein ImpE